MKDLRQKELEKIIKKNKYNYLAELIKYLVDEFGNEIQLNIYYGYLTDLMTDNGYFIDEVITDFYDAHQDAFIIGDISKYEKFYYDYELDITFDECVFMDFIGGTLYVIVVDNNEIDNTLEVSDLGSLTIRTLKELEEMHEAMIRGERVL